MKLLRSISLDTLRPINRRTMMKMMMMFMVHRSQLQNQHQNHNLEIYRFWAFPVSHILNILSNQFQNHSWKSRNMNICTNIQLNYYKISKMNRTSWLAKPTRRMLMNFVGFMMISSHVFVYIVQLPVRSVFHQHGRMFCSWYFTMYANGKLNDWHCKSLRYVYFDIRFICILLWKDALLIDYSFIWTGL